MNRCCYCNVPIRRGENPIKGYRQKNDDHVPPKSFFTKEERVKIAKLRRNLITVPSCRKCNQGRSQLDEKSKVISAFLALAYICSAKDTKKFSPMLDLMKGSINRQFCNSILSTAELVWAPNNSGIILPMVAGHMPKNLLTEWHIHFQKIVKGLYFHEYKTNCPDKQPFFFYTDPKNQRDIINHIHMVIYSPNTKQVKILENVFTYWVLKSPDSNSCSMVIQYRGIFGVSIICCRPKDNC